MNDIPGLPPSSLEANVHRALKPNDPGALPSGSQEEFSAAPKLRHELIGRLSNTILLAVQQTLHRLLPAGVGVSRQMPATCDTGLGSPEDCAAHSWTNRATGEQGPAALALQQPATGKIPSREPDHSAQWPSKPNGQTPGTQSFFQNPLRVAPAPAQQQGSQNTPPAEPGHSRQWPSNPQRQTPGTQGLFQSPHRVAPPAAQQQGSHNTPPGEPDQGPQIPFTALSATRDNALRFSTSTQSFTYDPPSPNHDAADAEPAPEQSDNNNPPTEKRSVRQHAHDPRAAATGTPDTRQAAANARGDRRTEASDLAALATPGSTPDSGQPPIVDVPRTPASHAARFAGQVSEVAERILVSLSDAEHGAEVRIQLRQSTLDGSGIRIFREAGELNVIFIAHTESALRFLAENQERFQTIIGERLRDDKVRIVLESATDRETSSEDNEGRSRQRYVPPDDPTLPE